MIAEAAIAPTKPLPGMGDRSGVRRPYRRTGCHLLQRAFCAAVLILGLAVSAADGDDFRIESKVFAGKSEKPVSQSITLFRAGRVYDYLEEPVSIAVFDKPHERFILLDPARSIKTEITTAELLAFTARLQAWAETQKKGLLAFAAKPVFETKFDDKTGLLTLDSEHLKYELDTVKANTDRAAQQYREFSDWYIRLNAMTHPGSTPPFPRMVVNDELSKRIRVAEKVKLTIAGQSQLVGREAALRSEHQILWRLLQKDLKQIAETGHQLASFKTVGYAEFREGGTLARR